MTCKEDCYHYDVCPKKDRNIACDNVDEMCKNFKDKSLIVELPCKVGEEIYILNKENIPQKMIFMVPDVRCHCPKEDYLCMASCDDRKHCYCEYHFNYDGSDIGEKVFRTKEEAEAKLKELNSGRS